MGLGIKVTTDKVIFSIIENRMTFHLFSAFLDHVVVWELDLSLDEPDSNTIQW